MSSAIPQEMLLAALEATQNAYVWVDGDGVVISINAQAQAILGRVHIGGHISECAEEYEVLRADGTPCPPLELPLARAALRGERVAGEPCKIRRPDGRIVDIIATAHPLRDASGAQIGALLMMRDVTDQQQLERKLRMSETRFQALVQATGQLVWVTDATGAVHEDSPSWRAFTGQTRSQWLGDGWLYVVHPEDRERAAQAWRAAVATGSLYQVEYRLRRRDGVYRWTLSRGAPTRDASGAVREWVGCTWDIEDLQAARPAAAG